MNFDVVIVGAGIAGCIFAERFSKEGKSVLIIEKRNHIGGNLYDHYNKDGILIHKYGPHIFRTSKKEVWDYLSTFTDWYHYQHKVVADVKGLQVPFPINLDTYNTLFNSNLTPIQFQEVLDKFKFTDDPKNAEEAVINQVGQYLYETFFKHYTQKQWGRSATELHPDTVKRVPVRTDRENRYFFDPYQGLPADGYTAMIEKMIESKNVRLMLNCDYKDVIDGIKFTKMVYTGPLDLFFDYKHGELNYRSLNFEEKVLDKESHQTHSVVNYPNGYDFTRITEYKKLTGQIHHQTALHYEYPIEYVKDQSDPYYPILDERNTKLRDKYFDLVGSVKNTLFIGRLAEYRYYAMDDIVEKCIQQYSEFKFDPEI